MKIDWVRKLTSRKFWAAIVAFVTALMMYSGATNGTVEAVVSIIMAGASLIAYIIGEGLTDAAAAQRPEYGAAIITPEDIITKIDHPPETK